MTTGSAGGSDPFDDDAAITTENDREFLRESTLSVGRNATLTLGTDSLIVLDEGLKDHPRRSCCGLWPARSTNTRSISYYNILWAEVTKFDLTIHYAKPSSKVSVHVAYINYTLDSSTSALDLASRWTKRLLDRCYGEAKRKKRVKLLINPYGGAGKAVKLYTRYIEPIFAAARLEVDVERTNYSGHAVEIAENLDIEAYDVLAACSGDGLPFEMFNGLAKKPNASEALRKIAVVQLPCGTGNAMSWNLNGTGDCSMAALSIVKGVRTPLDLVSLTQGDKRTLSFLSQSLGVVAETDLGTDNIRWMGDARFTFGFLVRLLGKTVYPCDIAVKEEIVDKQEIKRYYAKQMANRQRGNFISQSDLDGGPLDTTKGLGLPPLKYGTINDPLPDGTDGWTPLRPYPNLGNFYCGNMTIMAEDAPFFPASLPSDGLMDLITIDGDIGRMKALNLLLSVPKGTFFDMDCVTVRKVSAVRVIPRYGRWATATTNNDDGDVNNNTTRRRRGGAGGLSGKILGRLASGDTQNSSKDGGGGGGYFSVDGEKLPFEPFQIEIHKGLGTVLCRREGMYESPGPRGWQDIDVSSSDTAAAAGEQMTRERSKST